VVLWPGLNQDIEQMVKTCGPCQRHQRQNMAEPLLSHSLPTRSWQKVSTDLFELNKKDYVVIVNAYSNYPEVINIPSQSSKTIINVMKTTFARHGIPHEVMSDNGPCYISQEFAQFAKDWDFRHVTSSPNFPQSNGLAEKTVQTVKSIMKKCQEDGEDPHMGILAYRTTPLDVALSPAELLMGRQLRNNLPVSSDSLKRPASVKRVLSWKQDQRKKQKYYHDNHSVKPLPEFEPGQNVRIRNGNVWSGTGQAVKKVAPRSYLVKSENGAHYRRNRRDLTFNSGPNQSVNVYTDDSQETSDRNDSSPEVKEETDSQQETKKDATDPIVIKTRSGREIKKPERLIESA